MGLFVVAFVNGQLFYFNYKYFLLLLSLFLFISTFFSYLMFCLTFRKKEEEKKEKWMIIALTTTIVGTYNILHGVTQAR